MKLLVDKTLLNELLFAKFTNFFRCQFFPCTVYIYTCKTVRCKVCTAKHDSVYNIHTIWRITATAIRTIAIDASGEVALMTNAKLETLVAVSTSASMQKKNLSTSSSKPSRLRKHTAVPKYYNEKFTNYGSYITS